MQSENKPRILVYRRTHTGDPNKDGRFGCNNCMGRVRDWGYDAVIGIGGKSPDKGYEGITEKITWIGIGPKPEDPAQEDKDRVMQWDEVFGITKIYTFDKFALFDESGPSLKKYAPNLYQYMFDDHKIPRAGKNFQDKEFYSELLLILKLADNSPPSPARNISIKSNTVGRTIPATNAKSRGCS